MKIGFISLGCAKNLVDSEHIIALFDDPYFEYETDLRKCEAILINTCAFILDAKKESIDTILEIGEYKNDKLQKLIVTGCFSSRYYEECLKEFPEVDLFVKIEDYDKLPELLSDLFDHQFTTSYGKNRQLVNNDYSAYLKISDGCNCGCSFCAIPSFRGQYVSSDIDTLIAEAKSLKQKGIKELVLVAQDSTRYGQDLYGEYYLYKLLEELDKLDFKWIRILYMYPEAIDEKLLESMKKCHSVIPYFDIPIQYGNDEILKAMNRKGNVKLIKDKINLIRSYFDNAIIRTTILLGFPNETDETFKDTLDLIEEIKFDSLGAFKYSKEEGTLAYNMKNQVKENIKQQRYNTLMELQNNIVIENNKKHIGKTYEVLIDRYDSLFNYYIGRSYMSAPDGVDGIIYIRSDKQLKIGDFVKVEISDYKNYDLIGIIKENNEVNNNE